ncbi:hypothetical protein, partial [Mesorhizobium sp.]|uniref:hypothetical protein n=1 Tax=Mesorhizobium sp. TaxID=1871066 RepID=UPI0025FABEDC
LGLPSLPSCWNESVFGSNRKRRLRQAICLCNAEFAMKSEAFPAAGFRFVNYLAVEWSRVWCVPARAHGGILRAEGRPGREFDA